MVAPTGFEPVNESGHVFARIDGRLPRPLRSEAQHDSNTEGAIARPRLGRTLLRGRASRASAANLRQRSAGRPAVRRGTEVMFLAVTSVFATADGYLHWRYRTLIGGSTSMRVPVQKWGNSLAL